MLKSYQIVQIICGNKLTKKALRKPDNNLNQLRFLQQSLKINKIRRTKNFLLQQKGQDLFFEPRKL